MERNAAGFSERLEFTIELASVHLSRLNHAFWDHPRLDHLLAAYYPHLYGLMSASVAVFAAARDRSRALSRGCPVAARLAPYLARHVREERAHPGWLLEDMELLGVPRERAFACAPLPETAALIGTLYFWIHHAHPVAVLAYILIIEGNPPSVPALERALERTGLPAGVLRTFRRHAVIDVRHGAEVRELLDTLPLTDAHRDLVVTSAIASVDHLGRLAERVNRMVHPAAGTPRTIASVASQPAGATG